MKAYALLQEIARTPDSQLTVFAAFDAAWSEVADGCPSEGPERDEARVRLASAMLPFCDRGSDGPDLAEGLGTDGPAIIPVNE